MKNNIKVALFFLFVCVGFSLSICNIFSSYNGLLWASGLSLVSAIIIFVVFFKMNKLLPLFFSLLFSIGYLIRGVIVGLNPSLLDDLCPKAPDELCFSFTVGLIGWFMFVLGALITGRPKRLECKYTYGKKYIIITNCLIIVGLFSRAVHQAYSNSSFSSTFLGQLSTIGFICMLSRLVVARKEEAKYIWAIIFIYSGLGLLSGQRAACFLPIIAVIICSILIEGQFKPKKLILNLGTVILLFVVSYPFLTQVKLVMSKQRVDAVGKERVTLAQDVMTSIEMKQDMPDGNVLTAFSSSILAVSKRMSHLEIGAVSVIRGVERWGFLGGRSFYHSLIQFIPRKIWKNKPFIGFGEEVYYLQYGNRFGAATVPIAVDFFMNFGFVSLIIGMAVVGYIYSLLNNIVIEKPSPFGIAYLSVIAFDLAYSGRGIPWSVFVIASYGMVCYFLARICKIRTQSVGM
ncbi:hypothetical protein Pcar_1799 [Syntrophotalea carbinolica DSM 2380]|uniref:O-antigen polysaccharide polymerase Wzy n=1 Tax=Syntrophotalea carbinolica (strain DSM 2380 / NBRC 103641 / GraBd1) TaxID=338963 RepID=Q3A3L7_SYNC1|nr:hypothetical protein [Syntrophotalea carbinolica]ABA89040.1 hypothetical protein Pcar_1799 [Syntrophotalea carbinolica DSM 2380]